MLLYIYMLLLLRTFNSLDHCILYLLMLLLWRNAPSTLTWSEPLATLSLCGWAICPTLLGWSFPRGQTKMDAFSEIHRTSPWKCFLSECWIETDLVRSNESHLHQHVQQSCGCISALWQERLVQTMTSKKTISDEPPSAMTPTVKFQDGRIDWRNRSLQEPSSPGNFAWNLLTWSSLNTWEFDFQYFYQKSQCPLVPSSFPDYCSVQHLCEPPRIKHIGGGLFSIHLCATTTPKARTGFSAFLAVPDSRVLQRNGKNGRTFPRRSAASFVWVGHIAIAWLSGRSRGTSSLRRAACWNLGHQSAM